jgi:outer membrane lipopolysaccharide assembly protein LptE/RlpB
MKIAMKKIVIKWLPVLIIITMLFGCGYKFAGSGLLPGGTKLLFVSILENKTSEIGIGSRFTNDLIYEVSRHRAAKITSRGKADAVLSGTIKSLGIATISRLNTQTSQERRVTVTVDLKLVDRTGRTIWRAMNVSANEEYDVSADKLTTERSRRLAINDLSERMAETIYIRLTEDF